MLCFCALVFEIVGDFVDAVWPSTGRRPELDEPKCAEYTRRETSTQSVLATCASSAVEDAEFCTINTTPQAPVGEEPAKRATH